MAALLLSAEERERFASYLEMDAESDYALLGQMAEMNLPEAFTKKKKMELAAKKIVAQLLRATESVTVGS